MKRRTDNEILEDIVRLTKELEWEIIIMMDKKEHVPAILIGTPSFIKESSDAMNHLNEIAQSSEITEEEPLDIVTDQSTKPKRTFH